MGDRSSPQGPVYLGYRLGHIKADGRVFRALVYNKGAMVLHMLRRLMGDEAFFAGLRDFYATWRYKKAGTDDFRVAMEKAGGRALEPLLRALDLRQRDPDASVQLGHRGKRVRVRFEQKGDVFDVPMHGHDHLRRRRRRKTSSSGDRGDDRADDPAEGSAPRRRGQQATTARWRRSRERMFAGSRRSFGAAYGR